MKSLFLATSMLITSAATAALINPDAPQSQGGPNSYYYVQPSNVINPDAQNPSMNAPSMNAPSIPMGGPMTSIKPKDRFSNADDQRLVTQIRQDLMDAIGQGQANMVTIYVDAGDVQLLGVIPSSELKARVSDVVHKIRGVRSVSNKLEVNQAPGSAMQMKRY